jgi:hypothetical protein
MSACHSICLCTLVLAECGELKVHESRPGMLQMFRILAAEIRNAYNKRSLATRDAIEIGLWLTALFLDIHRGSEKQD